MGTFSPVGSLNVARAQHTATLLPDGKVLIAGGASAAGGSDLTILASAELYDPATGAFTLTGSLTSDRYAHTATLLNNGKVLLVAGASHSVYRGVTEAAELYNPATGTFAPTGSLTTRRMEHTATLLSNGKVLVVGGSSTISSTELYDPATGLFTPNSSLVTPRYDNTATLLSNGKVLILGGGNSTVLASAELYDPIATSFPPAHSLAFSRDYHTATLLPNGQVLVAGGRGDTYPYPLARAELYNPDADTFTATGQMVTARYRHTATLLPNGKVLIAGGEDDGRSLPNAELYDPTTGAFTVTGSLLTSRSGHTATLLPDGKVLIAGGASSSGYSNSTLLSSAELYDPATGAFTATNPLTITRSGHTATLLPNGKVLLTGGYSASSMVESSTELYDPSAATFSRSGSMVSARASHTATLLGNGTVLIAGGNPGGSSSSGNASASAEIYNPGTGFFSSISSLTSARYGHTATLLKNGQVLLTGGITSGFSLYSASAELYNPTTRTFTATGTMIDARAWHTATLLNNGKVLIVGGTGSIGGPIPRAELYSPNNAPLITSLSVSPNAPTTNGLLTANVSGSDPEGDVFATAYLWKKNGIVINGETTSTLDLSKAGNGDKDDQITVVVTLSDSPVTSITRESVPVTIVNSAPQFTDVSLTPQSPFTKSLLTASLTTSDPDSGDSLTASYVWEKNGVVIEGETSATLDLSQANNGDKGDQISVGITISDGHGGTAFKKSQTVTVEDSPPTSIALSRSSIEENQPSGTTVSSFTTTDPDADTSFTYSLVAGEGDSDNGAFQINGDQLQAVASLDFESKKDYTIRVSSADENGLAVEQVFAITVADVNEAPSGTVTLSPAAPTTNQVLTASVSGTDPDGNDLTYSYQWKRNDTVLEGEGEATLDLAKIGNGDKDDQITVVVVPNDGSLNGASASASVTVGNTPPTLVATIFPGRENQTLSAQVVAQDDDQETLTYSAATLPRYGTLVLKSDGTFTYTPRSNWNGTDGFQVSVQDGSGAQAKAVITLTVAPVNGVPIAANDVVKGNEDVPLTIAAATLLHNDSNGEKAGEVDPLSIIKVATPSGFPGTLKLDVTKQTILFTPKLNWNGTTTFTYTVQDSGKATVTAQVTLQIAPVNDAPVALRDRMTVMSGVVGELPLLGTDVEGDALTFALSAKPTNGAAQVVKAGGEWLLRYQSKIGFIGTDTLSVVARDGKLNSAPATVTITVKPDHAPLLVSLTPNKGTFPAGSTVVFEQKVHDTDGTSNLNATALLIGNMVTTANARGGAVLWFDATSDRFTVTRDDGQTTFSPVALGGTLENSQVKVSLSATDVMRDKYGLLTLRWHITFKPGFIGTKSLWMRVEDLGGLNAGFTKAGDITLTSAANSTAPSAPQS